MRVTVWGTNPFTHKRSETFTRSAPTGHQPFWNVLLTLDSLLRMMKRVLLTLGAAALLALPAAAMARVGVSGAAKDPLVHAAMGAAAPRQCAAVYISSINKFWSAVFYKPATGWGSRCRAFRKVAWTALHHTRGRWRIDQSGESDACVAVHVPVAIRRDLRIPCYPLLP
jgi:hypothetical protein